MDSNQLIQQVKKIIYKNNNSEFIELRYSFIYSYIYVVIYIDIYIYIRVLVIYL